ncbi:MAG: hypothetical protein ACK5KR_06185 [Breznakia sp.]
MKEWSLCMASIGLLIIMLSSYFKMGFFGILSGIVIAVFGFVCVLKDKEGKS